jgi:hypothetical protein
MTRVEAIKIIGNQRYGDTERLIYQIGKDNFKSILKEGLIYQGKQHPEIWRITDKGIQRSESILSKPSRIIALILWKLNISV